MKSGVDVLHRVVGIDAGDVRRRAVEIAHPGDASLRFRVMDPVDCLVSRLENLRRLAAKRDQIGVWQARLAIAVCRAYVEQLLSLDDERKAMKVATAAFRLAGSATGLQSHREYGLDILDAIPLDRFENANFRNEQAPRSMAKISKARKNL